MSTADQRLVDLKELRSKIRAKNAEIVAAKEGIKDGKNQVKLWRDEVDAILDDIDDGQERIAFTRPAA